MINMDIQFFGGRGASAGIDNMNVPYNEWGEEIRLETIRDKNGDVIGHISDEIRSTMVEDIRKITKKDIMDEIEAWKNDDNTYGTGTGDEAIYVFYNDGKMVNVTELEAGQKYKKSGIIGVSVSTGDYEMVWGEELHKGQRVKIKTWSEDGNSGYSNTYAGYKTSEVWKERVKTMYIPEYDKDGKIKKYVQKREVIRRSTKKKY